MAEAIPPNDIQRILLARLNGSDWSDTLQKAQPAKVYLQDILKRSITMGESNSALVVGPRGSGKTALINNLLQEICFDEGSDEAVLQVHLNGLLQTDDRIAIQEITRQLKLENAVEDKVFGSFADNLTFLLQALTSGNQDTKVIVCVLDEFDLFCAHHNQTLLYSLLDTSLLAHTPLVVIGLTCRLDVLELLEKRVKSRFSHRTLHFFSNHSFDEYVTLLLDLLSISAEDNPQWERRAIKSWNDRVKKLPSGVQFQKSVRRMFHLTKDIGTLKSFLFVVVSNLDDSHANLEDIDFARARDQLWPDSRCLSLQSLSVLELCLVLAMRQLHTVYDGESFNLEMVHREYAKFGVGRSAFQLNKEVVVKAFEHLTALELVRPITDGHAAQARVQKGYRLASFLLERSEVDDAVRNYVGLPTEVHQWIHYLAK